MNKEHLARAAQEFQRRGFLKQGALEQILAENGGKPDSGPLQNAIWSVVGILLAAAWLVVLTFWDPSATSGSIYVFGGGILFAIVLVFMRVGNLTQFSLAPATSAIILLTSGAIFAKTTNSQTLGYVLLIGAVILTAAYTFTPQPSPIHSWLSWIALSVLIPVLAIHALDQHSERSWITTWFVVQLLLSAGYIALANREAFGHQFLGSASFIGATMAFLIEFLPNNWDGEIYSLVMTGAGVLILLLGLVLAFRGVVVAGSLLVAGASITFSFMVGGIILGLFSLLATAGLLGFLAYKMGVREAKS